MDKIGQSLSNKLKSSDLEIAQNKIDKYIKNTKMNLNLITKKCCHNCCCKNNCKYVFPMGNIDSKIFVILDKPTELESEKHTLFYDENGRMLYILLAKIGLSLANTYYTTVAKCYSQNNEVIDALECSALFLTQEIEIVKPVKVIAFGSEAINVCRLLFTDLPEITDINIERGKIIAAQYEGHSFSILQSYSTTEIFKKIGSIQNKCKKDLWDDLCKFLKS